VLFIAASIGVPGALVTAAEPVGEQRLAALLWVLMALFALLPTWASILWKWHQERGFHRLHAIEEVSKLEEGDRRRLLGRVRARETVLAPNGERCAAYVLTVMRGPFQQVETRCLGDIWLETPDGEVKLEAEPGSALLALDVNGALNEDADEAVDPAVDPEATEIGKGTTEVHWQGEEAKALAASYGLPFHEGNRLRLRLLRPGDLVSVLGHVSRTESRGGYRDHAPAILSANTQPLSFRTKLTATEEAHLAQGLRRVRVAPSDRSEDAQEALEEEQESGRGQVPPAEAVAES